MQKFTKTIGLFLLLCLLGSIKVMAQKPDSTSAHMADSLARYRQDSLIKAKSPKVTGTVKDAATGKAISGVSISIEGFSAALTDDQGHFQIAAPSLDAVLMVSYQGSQRKFVALRGLTKVPDILLFEDTYTSIYDEAKLPFGAVPASRLGNAVSSVNTYGAWEPSKLETADSYLQGKVAGLNVIRRSGTPNIGANLILRGFNSLYATNAPLIVLDGMIFDTQHYGNSIIGGHVSNPFGNLDLHDIDNFTVLKDAQAGMYGTKGSNGVILITTNSNPDLATRIDLGLYSSYNYFPQSSLLPIMKAGDFRTYLSDLLGTTALTSTQIASLPFMNDAPSNPDYFTYHNDTNWQRQAFANGYNKNIDLRVSGGDNIARYVLSMGYGGNKGITPNTDLTKYNTRFNGNLNVSKNFTINTTLSFAYSSQNLRDQGLSRKTNPMFASLIKAPILRQQDVNSQGVESPNQADVDIFGYSNPSVLLSKSQQYSQSYRFFGNFNFKYQINRYLAAQSLIGVTADKVRENIFVPRTGVTDDTLANGSVVDSRLGSQVQRLFNLYNDTYLSYNRSFNNIHQLSAYLGSRYTQSDTYSNVGLGYNSAIDQLVSVTYSVPTLRVAGGDLGSYRWFNHYFNANYSLYNKYIFGFNVTADASSRFGNDVPGALHVGGISYAVLPSGSAAWIISSERFMSGLKFIELLKLRASYGLTGNDDIGNYTARQYYVSQALLGQQGLVRANFGNPALQWEQGKKLDLGIDASFMQDRLTIQADYYNNQTTKMLTQTPTASSSGIVYAITNGGGMKTNGVELNVNGRILNKPNLKWDLGFNIASYHNKITSLPVNNLISSYAGANILTSIGHPLGVFYGYKTNGVYASNAEAAAAGVSVRNASGNLVAQRGGDMRFVDVNNDKVIDSKDMQIIGNPNPDFSGGISTTLSYKKFTFSALISYVKGNKVYNYTRRMLESESNFYNQSLAVNNRWRGDGQVTSTPRASYGDPSGNAAFSDRWIEDGSYIRLRSATASYDIPLKNKYFKYVKVYVTGYNLLTFTKYLGYDPEFAVNENVLLQGIDNTLEPQVRNVQLGIRVGI